MSTFTMGLPARLFGAVDTATATEGKKGLFARMLDRAIKAREVEARRRAAAYLQFLSDERLVELGMSAQDIQLMRDTGRVSPTLWS